MVDKTAKQAKMNTNEFAFNKQLLRQINQKLKTQSQLARGSQPTSMADAGSVKQMSQMDAENVSNLLPASEAAASEV